MFYLEVGDVRPARDQQSPPPQPDVQVTGQSLNMDLFQVKAETGGEAGIGGADVSAHSGRINLKGGWLLCSWHQAVTDLLGSHQIGG